MDSGSLLDSYNQYSLAIRIPVTLICIVLVGIAQHVIRQVFFSDKSRPPVVFHLFPGIGSTIRYGMDPFKFFFDCREKYGDCFTFTLLGKSTTVYLGAKGNQLILNGKHADLNAEEVYNKLTGPIFGKGVVYDCSHEKFLDQKRLLVKGFSPEALCAYIPLSVKETEDYISSSPRFQGQSGICNITEAMAEITLYTAASSLQGKEVRSKFDSTFAVLYRHLDDGFQPINFMAPWLPLPQNRRRDHAQQVMEQLYSDIIARRRQAGSQPAGEKDMIWSLMGAQYKDGSEIPDAHIARLMIALLMGGQHNTAVSNAWMMLNLAHKPQLIEEMYQEQLRELGAPLPALTWEGLQKLKFSDQVIKETLRLHSPIHSIMRQVKSPIPVPGTPWVIPTSHTLLAAPGVPARSQEFFPNPFSWDPHRWDTINALDKSGDSTKVDYGFGLVNKSVNSPYLPFGAGRHRCVGEQYAYAQLGAIMATMVRSFKWEQVDPSAPLPATDYSSMFSRPMNPATIKWQRRV